MVTIKQILEEIDSLLPNSFSVHDKIQWLNKLDGQIYRKIVNAHEDPVVADWKPYDPEMDPNQQKEATLIVDDDHSEVYIFWLQSRIHYNMQEYDKYNAATSMFHDAYNDYAKDYNRSHTPKQPKYNWF